MKFITTLAATFMLSACVTTGNGVDTLNIHNKSVIQVGAEVFKAEKLPAPTVVVMHGCGGVSRWCDGVVGWVCKTLT